MSPGALRVEPNRIILIVDDEPGFRKTLADILEKKGFQTSVAPDGKTALDQVKQSPPAAALIDLKLEDMSGLDVIREIKRVSHDTVCIVLTGQASQESAIEAINRGAYGYVKKPYNIGELMLTVTRALERWEGKRALADSEMKYRRLIEAAGDAIFVADAETGLITDLNRQAETLVGYNADEIIGQHHTVLHPPEDADRYRQSFKENARVGRGFGKGSVVYHKSGRKIPVEINPSVMVMNNRRYIIGLFRDMTVHLENQEKILKSREQFRVIFEESPDAILIVSIEGIVLQINASVTRILGYTDKDLTGNPFSRFFPPQSEFELTAWKKNLTVRGAVFEAQEFVCADGGICPVDLTATMIPWENRRAILVTLRDVRERKAAEETIRRSEQKYRLLAENVGDVIWVLNRELKMVYVSPSVERLLGYTPDEMKRMPLAAVMTETTHGRMIQMLNDSLSKAKAGGQNGGRRMEIQQIRKNHTSIWVEVITTPLRDANGNLTGILGVTRDIDDRKRAETQLQNERADLARRVSEQTADLRRANAQLARSARLKDEFLAGMSHELRTPLNAVLGMTEALQEEVYGPLTEKQVKSLKRIEESGRHLLSLINDILDLSKIEAGKFQPEMTPVRISDTCEVGLRMIRQTAHKKSITVDSFIDPEVGYIRGDERSMKQIVVNLLSNAVKFTPEGGRIDLEVVGDREEGVARIHVIDTGIGISVEDADRLFQPFVQLDGALSRKYEGTGLGLSLVSRLAEIHGGGVTVSSKPGKGSRFTVMLPWNPGDTQQERPVDVSAEVPADTTPDEADPDIRGVRILLAEDNEDNIDTFVDYLTALNFDVDVARNGADAVRHAMEAAPDLILMDIQMPEVDGLEAIRRIRDNGCTVPIIALTALAMPGDRERCLKAGADEYVSKPVNLRTLSQLIRRVTGKKENSRTERRTG